MPSSTGALPRPANAADRPVRVMPAGLPTADEVVAHTLLNCLLRELSGPEHQTAVSDGHLLLRLPRRGVLLRVALRRTSLLGAHRFTGAVAERCGDGWAEVGWRRLAEHAAAELSLRTGVTNAEFAEQVASSHQAVTALLDTAQATGPSGTTGPSGATSTTDTTGPGPMPAPHRAPSGPAGPAGPAGPFNPLSPAAPAYPAYPTNPTDRAYLASEQSLLFGHRFHPTPKARTGDPASWEAYAPEARACFPLRLFAVRGGLLAEECAAPGALAPLDTLGADLPDGCPDGYRLLPAHPWQCELLGRQPGLAAALERGDVIDLGTSSRPFAPTASVRTLHDLHDPYGNGTFLKFSLNVRITNCLRKNARYELYGAVALTRVLEPVLADLEARFPHTAVLREPAFRTLALPGPDGACDRALFEGFGVIVREGLRHRLRPGTTPLLAAAIADEYPTGPAQIGRLLGGAGADAALAWWAAYLDLLIPPVLAAYLDHGVVLEPHLQNVLVCVDGDGTPAQVLFRDLEGTKLLADRHATTTLATLPPQVAGPMTYDAERGWDRVVYCLLVNHVAELLAALADLHPHLEAALWARVRATVQCHADAHGCPPRLAALLAGVPLPAKANLLTRWQRKPDREAAYVRLASPFPLTEPR